MEWCRQARLGSLSHYALQKISYIVRVYTQWDYYQVLRRCNVTTQNKASSGSDTFKDE